MTTPLTRKITVDDGKFWQGPSRVVLGPLKPTGTDTRTLPTKIEDILITAEGGSGATAQWTLKTGWSDLGPVQDDGVEIGHEWDVSEGIAIDQQEEGYGSGRVENERFTLAGTRVHTNIEALAEMWNMEMLPDVQASGTGSTAVRAQKVARMGSMRRKLPERYIAVLQQDQETNQLRAFIWYRGKTTVPGNLPIGRTKASTIPFTFTFYEDTAHDAGFGIISYMDMND